MVGDRDPDRAAVDALAGGWAVDGALVVPRAHLSTKNGLLIA